MKEIFLKVEESKLQFFLELIKNLDFVQLEEHDGDSKEEIKANLTEGLKEIEKFKKKELKTTSAMDFVNGF